MSDFMEPLTGAVYTPDEIKQIVDEMLVAGEKWHPQYAEEIEKAKKRLENKTVAYRPIKGFTFKTKTIEEIAEKKPKKRQLSQQSKTGNNYDFMLKPFIDLQNMSSENY